MDRLRNVVGDPAIVRTVHLAMAEARYVEASQALARVEAELHLNQTPALIWRGEAYANAAAIRAFVVGPDAERALVRFAASAAPFEALAEAARAAGGRRGQEARGEGLAAHLSPPGSDSGRDRLRALREVQALDRVFRLETIVPDDVALWGSVLADAERLSGGEA